METNDMTKEDQMARDAAEDSKLMESGAPVSIGCYGLLAKPITVEYAEHGGYDCMTSAYYIKDANGRTIADIDSGRYGQKNCHNAECEEARAVAEHIANALNSFNG